MCGHLCIWFWNYHRDIQCSLYFMFLDLCLKVDDYCLQGPTFLETKTDELRWLCRQSLGCSYFSNLFQNALECNRFFTQDELIHSSTKQSNAEYSDLVQSVPLRLVLIPPFALCPPHAFLRFKFTYFQTVVLKNIHKKYNS